VRRFLSNYFDLLLSYLRFLDTIDCIFKKHIWVRVDLGYELTWVRVDRGYELTWVRVDLVRVDFGYELTVKRFHHC